MSDVHLLIDQPESAPGCISLRGRRHGGLTSLRSDRVSQYVKIEQYHDNECSDYLCK